MDSGLWQNIARSLMSLSQTRQIR